MKQKNYRDDGKFATLRWLVYPQLSLYTWRMGYGKAYWMNSPYETEDFKNGFVEKPIFFSFYFFHLKFIIKY